MRQILVPLLLIPFLLSCAGSNSKPAFDYSQFNSTIHYSGISGFTPVIIRIEKVSGRLRKGGAIKKGDLLGNIQKKPEKYKGFPDEEISRADGLYTRRDYPGAANIYIDLLKKFGQNVFVLEKLGRALFWIDKEQAYRVYSLLFSKLEKKYRNELRLDTGALVIDPWFIEANWKLACLYLDRREYRSAALRITMALMGGLWKHHRANVQALGYLTEAQYFIGNYHYARYFFMQTKKIDPGNRYVEQYRSIFNSL